MKKFYFYNEVERRNKHIVSTKDTIALPLYGYNIIALRKEIATENIFGEYLLNCIRTWNQSSPPLYQIPNAALGLIGEVAEYMEKPSIDELGDILYYRSILLWLLGEYTQIYEMTFIDFKFNDFALLLSDFTKKAVYHDKMYDTKTVMKYRNAMSILDAYIWKEMKTRYNLRNFDVIFQENIAKLSQRHVEGFDPNYGSKT